MAGSHWRSPIVPETGTRLLELEITGGDLNEIKARDLHGLRGLKRLDLSENQLQRIANDAFEEVCPVSHDRSQSWSCAECSTPSHRTSSTYP